MRDPDDFDSYRLSKPFRYSAAAAVIAAAVAFVAELWLWGRDLEHAWKSAATAGASWFFVLLVLTAFVRIKRG